MTPELQALNDRIAQLEAKLANKSKPPTVPVSDQPMCHWVHLLHCGRQLWTIDGLHGVYARKREHGENSPCVLAQVEARRCKGRSRVITLFRLNELSDQIVAMVEKWKATAGAKQT